MLNSSNMPLVGMHGDKEMHPSLKNLGLRKKKKGC